MLADHARTVRYQMTPPPTRQAAAGSKAKQADLYVHVPRGRVARSIDDATEKFVDDTRMGATP
jgi:hypothetical protein